MSYKEILESVDDSNFEVVKFWHFPIPKQSSIYNRPYTVDGRPESINRVVDKVLRSERDGSGREYSSKRLSEVTRSILKPSTVAFDTPIDDEWWEETRFSFLLSVLEIGYNTEQMTYIFGYTDSDEIIENEDGVFIPDDTVYYISAIIETYIIEQPVRGNRTERVEHIEKVYNLLGGGEVEVFHGQRPMDIFMGMAKDDFIEDRASRYIEKDGRGGRNPFKLEGRVKSRSPMSTFGGFNDRISTTKASNSVPSYYLSETITEGVGTEVKKLRSGTSRKRTSNKESGMLSDIVGERVLLDNNLIARLNADNGYNNFSGKFTFGDIIDIDEEADSDDILEVFENVSTTDRNNMLSHAPDSGEEWDSRDTETIIATGILTSISSLVTDMGFVRLRVIINNMDRETRKNPVAFLAPIDTFIGKGNDTEVPESELISILNNLKNEIFHNVYLVETRGGRDLIDCEAIIDVKGTTKIYLSMFGDEGDWYTLPSAGIKYIIPEICYDSAILQDNRDSFKTIIQDIVDLQNGLDDEDAF